MAVRKTCSRKPGAKKFCSSSPRCDHEWWFDVMYRGVRYKKSVNEFAVPLMPESDRHPVLSKQEAVKVWEPRFLAEIVAGKDPRRVELVVKITTINDFIDTYKKRHCEAEKLNMDSHGQRLERIRRQFGTKPLATLERPNAIEAFKG